MHACGRVVGVDCRSGLQSTHCIVLGKVQLANERRKGVVIAFGIIGHVVPKLCQHLVASTVTGQGNIRPCGVVEMQQQPIFKAGH